MSAVTRVPARLIYFVSIYYSGKAVRIQLMKTVLKIQDEAARIIEMGSRLANMMKPH